MNIKYKGGDNLSKKAKTNACRMLDQKKIPYVIREYYDSDALSGKDVANFFGEDEKKVFKTLVLQGKSGEHYVMIIPSSNKIDLKKAAKSVNEKSVSMIFQKDLEPLTGYEHGGCSPIGMKKVFTTIIQKQAFDYDTIYISGGRIGLQLEINPNELQKIIKIKVGDVIED